MVAKNGAFPTLNLQVSTDKPALRPLLKLMKQYAYLNVKLN
jgi:hypothetical protein